MQNLYATSDLNIAAFLALQFHLEKMDRSNPKRVQFFFEDSEKLQGELLAYWNNEAAVSPMALLSSVRNLKHRLYDQA